MFKINSFSILLFTTALAPLLYFSASGSIPSNIFFLLLIFALFYAIREHHSHASIIKFDKKQNKIILFLLFYLFGGLSSSIINKTSIFTPIHNCLVPVISTYVIFVSGMKIKYIGKVAVAYIISIFCLLFLTHFSLSYGFGFTYHNHEVLGRMAGQVIIGPINYAMWGNWLSATAIMVFPVLAIYLITNKFTYKSLLVLASLNMSIYYILRGATFGGVFSIILTLMPTLLFLIYLRIKFYNFGNNLLLLGNLIVIVVPALIISVSQYELSYAIEKKIDEYLLYGIVTPNLEYRYTLIMDSINNLVINPFGIGFGTLWNKAMIDEANYYSVMINGTGLIGVIGFVFVTIILTKHFILRIFNNTDRNILSYSIVGISTMSVVLLAALSSDQILTMPQTNLPFWVFISALYVLTKKQSSEIK